MFYKCFTFCFVMLPDSYFGLRGVQGMEIKATAGNQKKHTFNFATQMDAKSKILQVHLAPPSDPFSAGWNETCPISALGEKGQELHVRAFVTKAEN